jgi:putative ABC transport system permease protein
VTPEYFAVNNVKELTAGNFFDQEDVDGRLRVAILGARAAEELFTDGTYPLGESVKIGGASYRVIAVAKEIGGADTSVDNNIYIPLTVAQAYLPPSRTKRGLDAFSAISITTTSEESTDAAVDQITRILRAQHGIAYAGEDDFQIITQKDLLETFNTITAGFTVFLGSIAGISLLVGGIGIMNIMLVSVTERTREIGIRKAIGALQRDILIQFMIEALVLSLLGGLIGVGLGMLAAFGIGPLFDVTAIVDLPTITLATSFAAAVGLVFGIYPAWRAARLRPIEALRYE